MRDWDDAFNNMGHVKGSDALPGFWAARAADYRKGPVRIDSDISYGDSAREVFDLIWPDTPPRGVLVFVHGGFWMRLDKSYWTDLAEGARAHGWAVCIPSYTLTPVARISEITKQIATAIEAVGHRVDGPIRLAGHSAGGHLATRMICCDSLLPPKTSARIEKTVSISGLHDLRPLLRTAMNATLKLTEAEAAAESAALRRPIAGAKVTAWVGGAERPEFLRQSQLLAMMWDGLDADTNLVVEKGHNHFTILDSMTSPNSALCSELAD
ncbi:alpha/beta hydrolase [Pseudophaeobacter sp.]|uniref:alpha/beta hydrolase n=1 Tax=Pseudophaeobacter sp. TaxID=1971739 RepID=UPI0025F9527A|nr:alpha/beta hydrolase [uncultured Pseudophaeobacter sp.]